ncbi:putative magnesium transporter NIPA9 [Vitis vinifera]|uniref:Probable magnesium transporter n=1 Tax=Vitis vinifera TaxID=29760 RepID=A0A438EXC0_VITVI|nr:putative magnesium transporter NIPA9 [Vitis vinifera]
MWESICLTLAATAGNNIGKVLQKKGTVILPPLSFKLKACSFFSYPNPEEQFHRKDGVYECRGIGIPNHVIRAYAFNKTWIVGFLMDIIGALLMLKALSQAPVSVIQPVSGSGLAILSIFSHFYLKEIMNPIDWMGIAMAGIGTIGVGTGGEEQKASSISIFHLPWLAFSVAILFVGILSHYYGSMVLLNGWLRIYRRQRKVQEMMQSEVVEEIIYGLESGILFGMASVISKMGFVFLEQGFSKILVPICISISICCSATGFIYQTRGLKDGRAIVVSTCAAVASILTGVLAGMLALGEQLPSAPDARLSLLFGWLLIIIGVILLVSSTWLVRHLPRPLRHYVQSGVERNFGVKHSGSRSGTRVRDSSPSAVIQASTLHHLITPPAKAKA